MDDNAGAINNGLPAHPLVKGLLGVIGHPISHSLSPVIHQAAIDYLGIPFVYLSFDIITERLGASIEAMRTLPISGLSVTMPHKATVGLYLDALSSQAEILQSVNAIYWGEEGLIGTSTDGPGFLDAFEAEFGRSFDSKDIVLIGTGGAARAIALALAQTDARQISVIGRSTDKIEKVISLDRSKVSKGSLADISAAEVVINATSVGMEGAGSVDEAPIPLELISSSQIVCDIVYHPLETKFLSHARRVGAATMGGVPMLVHQAARAFKLFTGEEAPIQVMRRAVEPYLS